MTSPKGKALLRPAPAPARRADEIQLLMMEQQLLIAESCARAQLHVEERERLSTQRSRLELEYLEKHLALPKIPGSSS